MAKIDFYITYIPNPYSLQQIASIWGFSAPCRPPTKRRRQPACLSHPDYFLYHASMGLPITHIGYRRSPRLLKPPSYPHSPLQVKK